jgi:hypothetical protein
LVCASVLRTLPPAAPPASPVAPALAPARGIIGLSYTAVLLFLVYTMGSQPPDKVEGLGDDFVRGGQDKTPTQKKRNNYERTVLKVDTPTVTVTEGNAQYCALWIVESPGGTVTTSVSAYNDGKKRCLSAEGASGDPRRKVSEQNNTFTRAFRKMAIASAKTRSVQKPTSAKRRCAVRPVRRK